MQNLRQDPMKSTMFSNSMRTTDVNFDYAHVFRYIHCHSHGPTLCGQTSFHYQLVSTIYQLTRIQQCEQSMRCMNALILLINVTETIVDLKKVKLVKDTMPHQYNLQSWKNYSTDSYYNKQRPKVDKNLSLYLYLSPLLSLSLYIYINSIYIYKYIYIHTHSVSHLLPNPALF